MKTNQAKAIAGIKYNLTTRKDYIRAERDCVKLIIAARKAREDIRAAELSEAKEVFKKRTRARSNCAICGTTIARGATHCRIHSRPQNKVIAAPAGMNPQPLQTERRKGNGNARVAPIIDPFAPLGYYSAPVQKIVAKWRDTIGDEMLQRYFSAVAMAVVLKNCKLELPPIVPVDHWQAVFEIGAAIAKVCADKRKAEAWILGGECAVNHRYESLSEIRAKIIKQGGKPFSVGALAAAFHRLKLSASKETAQDFRRFVITKTG
jgi:hypothetical protein